MKELSWAQLLAGVENDIFQFNSFSSPSHLKPESLSFDIIPPCWIYPSNQGKNAMKADHLVEISGHL